MELERRLAAVQEGREGRRLPERLHRQRRHRLGDPDQRRRRHLRRAEPRQHHRRLPAEPRDDQGLPAQGRRRRAPDHQGAAGGAAQAAHHRRRLQHGRRPRAAAGAVRARRGDRLHHDGRRCACERRVRRRTAAAPSITSACTAASTSRSARCRRRSARSAATSPATANLIDFLYHRARPFLFSTSHPPAVVAACMAALDVLMEEPEIIERLWDNTRFFKEGLQRLGFNTGAQREPDHAGHRRGRVEGDDAVGPAVRARASSPRASPSRPWRATRRACARS